MLKFYSELKTIAIVSIGEAREGIVLFNEALFPVRQY